MLSLADVLRVGAQTARGAWVGAGANSGAGAAPERLSQRGAADSSLPCTPLTARSTPRGRGRRDRSRRAPPPWWHRPAWRRTRAGAGTAARTRRDDRRRDRSARRSEEHTSELQSLMRISSAVFCLKKKKIKTHTLILKTKTYKIS